MQVDVVGGKIREIKKIVDIEQLMCYNTMNRLLWIVMRILRIGNAYAFWRCSDGE